MRNFFTADRVLTPDGWVSSARVQVDSDGLIAGIEQVESGPGDGSILAPGFLDLQVNGKDRIASFTDHDGDWLRLQEMIQGEGVTGWLPTLTSAPLPVLDERLQTVAGRCATAASGMPEPIGIHLEGPFLGSLPGAHQAEAIIEPNLQWIKSLPDAVVLMTVGIESIGAPDLITALRNRQVTVSLGHTSATPEQLANAMSAGATMVTHIFNASGPINQRSCSLSSLALNQEALACSVIADGIHVDDSWLALIAQLKAPDNLILVTDSVPLQGPLGPLDAATEIARQPDGTIAGSVLTMDGAVRHMVEAVGIPLENALRAASTNPARILSGRNTAAHAHTGRIAVGCRADLVQLDQHLHPAAVVVGGVKTDLL